MRPTNEPCQSLTYLYYNDRSGELALYLYYIEYKTPYFAGFLKGLEPKYERDIHIKELTLREPIAKACRGAAYLAAKAAGVDINVDYDKNSKVLYHKVWM